MLDLRSAVRNAYSAAAEHPGEEHPFPVGRDFAESLGYSQELLDRMPAVAVEAFTGVSCVAVIADLAAGATVLDLGCGAGLDSLLAARRVAPGGRILGVDFSTSMLARARRAAGAAGAGNTRFYRVDAEALPFEDRTFGAAMVNGLFNLNPAREAIFRELARVIGPGGSVWAAELILTGTLPAGIRADPANWFA